MRPPFAPRFLFLLCVMFVAACGRPDHRDLAAETRFELAHSHGRYVEVNGLDTFVISEGEGPDIVLVHGNPSSSYTWRSLIEPLSRDHRVHALDLPGYGFSEKPADAPYTDTWMAGHIAAYLRGAGIESAIVIGNSMGGEVASELAAVYPRATRGLILIAPAGLKTDAPDERPLAMRIASYPVARRILPYLPLRSVFASTLRDAYYDPSLVTDADVDAYYAPARSRNGLIAFLARMHRDPNLDRTSLVRTIRAPTLVILGELDRLVPLSVGRRYGELIPDSRVVVIEKGGHVPQEERPEAVLQVIEDWLRRLER
jgi:pimeloyl-ACP methyl ester carboxylesterase